jgi:hypothetical protein
MRSLGPRDCAITIDYGGMLVACAILMLVAICVGSYSVLIAVVV